MNTTDYITDDAHGEHWRLMLGDSCERLAEIPDDSVHLSVYSPPFASLFTYSPSIRDLGNSSSRAEFIEHYGYIIRENLRVTVPGRIACVHVQQLTTTKATHGYTGLTDFRGDVIRAYVDNGWHFHGEVTVNKDPQAQAIRTKAHALTFATKNRDSSGTRPAAVAVLRRRAPHLPAAVGLHRACRAAVVQPRRDRSEPVRWHRFGALHRREVGPLRPRV